MEPRIAGDYAPQPSSSSSEREHPRYGEYCRYRAAMASQLVTAATFRRWLQMAEDYDHSAVEVRAPRAE